MEHFKSDAHLLKLDQRRHCLGTVGRFELSYPISSL